MAAPGVAVPGSIVAIGSQVSPAGPQGIQGPTTVSANANNKATLGSDSLVLVQGTAIGVAATTHAQTVSGDDPQLTNTRMPSAHASTHITGGIDTIAPASTSTAGLLKQISGLTTDFIDGTNASQNLITAVQPTIWSVRTRSFSSVGNASFEVDQISCGTSNAGNGKFIDRWVSQSAGIVFSSQQNNPGSISIPGTNFSITSKFYRITLTTQKVSLAAGDYLILYQNVEGPQWRELSLDVHSFSILCRSSVAGLKFGVSIADNPQTKTLSLLSPALVANTWTLVQFPNLPVWPSGNWALTPGSLGYNIYIALAAGTTYTAPSNSVWNAGTFFAANTQSNFAASVAGSTIDVAFVQHEPGSSSTLMDVPFSGPNGNLEACQRYYQKTYQYSDKPGTITQTGMRSWIAFNGAVTASGPTSFLKVMAKVPTVTFYNYATGAANSVRDGASGDHASAAAGVAGDSGFAYVQFAGAVGANTLIYAQYTLDTGM
jgi:hypothetical protein